MPNVTGLSVRNLGPLVQAAARYAQQLYAPPKETIRGITQDGWYSPLQPVAPIAPPGTQPRGFQYLAGQNLNWVPRFDAEYTAATLKWLATYPLARICIENVKDVLCKASWTIDPKPEPGETRKQATMRGKGDKNILKLMRFFERPDREHAWDSWLRPLIEDMLVIDAPAILIRKTFAGDVAELVVLRGESIVRYIDENGLTPMAPDPAYAQNWWGIPLVNLSTDQLLYKPRNIVPRNTISSQLYGMPPTEQLAPEIEVGWERLGFVKSYYTEGSIPGMMQIIPKGVTPDKIAEAMLATNSELAGNFARRHQLRLIQGLADQSKGEKDEIVLTKEPLLADLYDEMMTRRIAFGFGVSPQRLMKQMNRASSEQADEASQEEGTLPYFGWLKASIMDDLIQYKFGMSGYEWIPDPFREPSFEKLTKAAKDIMSVPVFVPNEIRDKFGEEPRPEPEANQLGAMTATGWQAIGLAAAVAGATTDEKGNVTVKPKEDNNEQKPKAGSTKDDGAEGENKPAGGKPNGAAAKSRGLEGTAQASTNFGFGAAVDNRVVTATAPMAGQTVALSEFSVYRKASAHDTRRAVIHPGRSLPQTVVAFHHANKLLMNEFKGMRKKTRRLLQKALAKDAAAWSLRKASDEEDLLKQIEKSINDNWKTIADDSWQDFEAAALAGASHGALQMEMDSERMISKVNNQAKEWAKERSAELVGMRRTESGRLVKNLDARWAISDTTREKLRGAISRIFATEDANLLTAEEEITKAGIFDDQRATMIARTEMGRAQALSNISAWRTSGEVSSVSWQLSADHDDAQTCDCSDNADNSPYAIEEIPEFPAHPNCMCTIVLETLKGEEE